MQLGASASRERSDKETRVDCNKLSVSQHKKQQQNDYYIFDKFKNLSQEGQN